MQSAMLRRPVARTATVGRPVSVLPGTDRPERYIDLPAKLLPVTPRLLEDMESTTGVTAGNGGSIAQDTVNYKDGANGLKLTVGVNSLCWAQKTVTYDLSLYQAVRFWLWIPAAQRANITSISILLSNDTGITKYVWVTVLIANLLDGWNHLQFHRSEFSVSGAFFWDTSIVRVRFRLTASVSSGANITYDQFEAVPRSQPAVVLTFADVDVSPFTLAHPILHARHIRLTWYAVTNNVGNATKATWPMLRTLALRGWNIGNHTADHSHMTTLNLADQTTQWSEAQTDLEAQGLHKAAKHLNVPYGEQDANTLTAAGDLAMLTMDSTITANPEIIPVGQALQLRVKQGGVLNTTTVATVKGWIDTCVTEGSLLLLGFHTLVTSSPGSEEYAVGDFRQIIDYIVQRGLPILTIDDFYRLLSAGIRVPRPGGWRR